MLAVDTELERVPTERLEAEVQTLAGHLAAATCRWLLMIAELDRREAWKSWEALSMAHWLTWKCGVSLVTGRDHVRVARSLETLPLVRERFARGQLSFSKVRALTRLIALPEMEADLVEMAATATAAQLDRIAAGYRRALRLADRERDRRNHEARNWSLITDDVAMSTLVIRAPSDEIAPIKAAVDAALDSGEVPDDGDPIAARRVDALVVVARHFLQPDTTRPVATAIVMREHRDLANDDDEDELAPAVTLHGLPISRAAFERLRCDAATAVERVLPDGSITRTPLTATIPRSIRRAVRSRDLNTCRWPGCTSTAHLHVHHITFRSRGGDHAITNLVLLCSHHHTVVHLGLWKLSGDPNRRITVPAPAAERSSKALPAKRAARPAISCDRTGGEATMPEKTHSRPPSTTRCTSSGR